MRRCTICHRPMKMEYVEYPRMGPDRRPVLYRNVRRWECPEGCPGVRMDFSVASPAASGVHLRVIGKVKPLKKPAEFNDWLLAVGMIAFYLLFILVIFNMPMQLPYQIISVVVLTALGLAVYRAATTRVELPSYFEVPRPVQVIDPEAEPKQAAAAATVEKSATAAATVVKEGTIPMVVTVDGQTHEIKLNPGENMLLGALDRNVELEYSCLEGHCDSCLVTVLAGLENISPPTNAEIEMLGADEVQRGKRLSCQVKVHGPVTIVQE